MTDRRSLLKLLAGGGFAASGMSTKDAAKAIGLPDVPPMNQSIPMEGAVGHLPATHSIARQRFWRVRERATRSPHTMPAHIATKKSWSPVFKEAVRARETEIWDRFAEELEYNEAFVEKALELLGVTE